MAQKAIKKQRNLRGCEVEFTFGGRGVVVTHIRNGRWMIESNDLPANCKGRVTLERRWFRVIKGAK